MAVSGKGFGLTGLLGGRRGRGRGTSQLVKQSPDAATPTVITDVLFTPFSGNYTFTCLGGSYALTGQSAALTYTSVKPQVVSAVALNLGTSATPGAQTITVPADAQLVVVHATSYTSGGLTLSISSNFSGSFTTTTAGDGSDKCHIAYAVVSSTGTKTITPVWSAAVTDGPIFVVTFVNNVNTSDFLREAKAYNVNTQGSTTNTTITSTVSDLVLALERQSFTTTAPTVMSGFTSITTSGINNLGTRLQSCNAPGATTTTLQSSGTDFPGFAAISIKAAAAGAYTLVAQGGSYSLGGGSVVLKRGKLVIASGGNYTLTGQNANLVKGRVLTAQAGTYVLTGGSANLLRSKVLVSSGGSYSLTGASATLLRSKLLTAQGGSYTYTGQQITITYTAGSVSYVLTALGGSYSLTGGSANLLRSKLIVAQGGGYALLGSSATLLKSKRIASTGGVYNLTGANANLLKSKVLAASGGTYSYVGASAVLKRSKYLMGTGGSYSLVGSNAVITFAGVGGAVWPPTHLVVLGTVYGPTGTEYTGTLDVNGIKYDIITGQLVKPINDKVVMSL